MDEQEIRTKMFNTHLILDGFTEATKYFLDIKYSHFFIRFSLEAKVQRKGIWDVIKKQYFS